MQKLTDLRFIIGLFFLILSVLLAMAALFPADHSPAHGTTTNLYTACIFSIFGISMMFASRK